MADYIKNPFLPQKRVTLVLLDSRAHPAIKEFLVKRDIAWIEVPPHPALYAAVSCHPDMQCHPLGGNRILLAPNVNQSLNTQLIQQNFEIHVGNTRLVGNYPHNIAYNVARLGETAFHHRACIDPSLKRELLDQAVCSIHVHQGYAKCSVAPVHDRALMTSDKGIADAAKACGIDVLRLSAGYIALTGLNYGFIGGACGLIAPDEMLFAGSLAHHPDGCLIRDFLHRHHCRPVEVENMQLMDVGSIIPLMEAN